MMLEPGDEIVAAVAHEGHILIFSKRGRVFRLMFDFSTYNPKVEIMLQL
jgi:hypothetical protein